MIKKRLYFIAFLLSAANCCLQAQQKVKTHEGVNINGIQQWIGAKSKDDTKPLLLFLHGGPGFSSRAYSRKFIKYLQKDFIVAQWDQRGTGITAAWGSEADSLTIDLMHSDTREVVYYLLTKFNKRQLYLVGFSWGGFLGLHFANEHPELLHAYISVSAMINGNASEQLTLEMIREKARISENAEAMEALSTVTIPFDSWESLYAQRKWTAFFSGATSGRKHYPESLFRNWSSKWMPIFVEASAVNYTEIVPELHCPVYFFISGKDLVANHQIAEHYYDKLQAKQKEIVWFEHATHEIPTQEPKRFAEQLIHVQRSLE